MVLILPAPPVEDMSSNVECPACYGSNESSCNEQFRKCYKEERCVNLVAEFKNGTSWGFKFPVTELELETHYTAGNKFGVNKRRLVEFSRGKG